MVHKVTPSAGAAHDAMDKPPFSPHHVAHQHAPAKG